MFNNSPVSPPQARTSCARSGSFILHFCLFLYFLFVCVRRVRGPVSLVVRAYIRSCWAVIALVMCILARGLPVEMRVDIARDIPFYYFKPSRGCAVPG